MDPNLQTSGLGRDSIEVGSSQLIEHGFATAEEIQAWADEAAETVQKAVAIAQKESEPDPFQDDWAAFSNPNNADLHS